MHESTRFAEVRQNDDLGANQIEKSTASAHKFKCRFIARHRGCSYQSGWRRGESRHFSALWLRTEEGQWLDLVRLLWYRRRAKTAKNISCHYHTEGGRQKVGISTKQTQEKQKDVVANPDVGTRVNKIRGTALLPTILYLHHDAPFFPFGLGHSTTRPRRNIARILGCRL